MNELESIEALKRDSLLHQNMEQYKLYECQNYMIEKLKLLEDNAENTAKTAINSASEDETSQRSINRPKNIHFCGPLSNFEKSGNSGAFKKHIKVPRDFDQLVVSDTDKKTSQLFQYKGLKLEEHPIELLILHSYL